MVNPARARQRKYETANREKEAERKAAWRARTGGEPRHGVPRPQIAAQLARQGGLCACCGSRQDDRGWRVDVDARDRSLRGVLCATCATGVGAFQGAASRLRAALRYVEEHQHRRAQLRELL